MVLYPEVQKRAQDEIDQVIGNERLPRFSDRDSLPYIGCIVQVGCPLLPQMCSLSM